MYVALRAVINAQQPWEGPRAPSLEIYFWRVVAVLGPLRDFAEGPDQRWPIPTLYFTQKLKQRAKKKYEL